MRLFTHNFLQCHVKGCTSDNFPLPILPLSDDEQIVIETLESEYNESFMRGFLNRIDWTALRMTLVSLNMDITHVSEEQPDSDSISSEQLEALHRILFQTDIKSAKMVCKGCGHIYRIRDGIPNMLLGEDEI